MTIVFSQYRAADSIEILVTINRSGGVIPAVEVSRHDETKEINSIKVEIIDNKPLYIPLGRTDQMYKIQFKTFTISDFNAWYSVLGNDVLKVISSSYAEFPVDSYWSVENISSSEVLGSASAYLSEEAVVSVPRGTQVIIMEYELQLSASLVDVIGRPRT